MPPGHRHPAQEPRRGHAAWTGSIIAPAAAGVATLCAATALTGVIRGTEWFGHILVAVLLIGCTGLALRSLRAPALAVGFAQLVVLMFLITGLYTSHGILGIIPGPAALAELNSVLAEAGQQIQVSLPPVEGKAGILCLATIGIGLVAVVVDTLAVSLAAPAAAGLVLLCLYAVPASLADEMLPWWSFILGAAAFAVLIAVDGNHRHRQWRGRGTTPERSPGAVSLPSAVVGVALSLGLLAGAAITGIGTVGHLPFVEEGESSSFTGGLGLQPLTKLQGLLNDQGTTEVFRVEGLGDDERLLRAFTLDTYTPNVGWQLHEGEMPHGVPANTEQLPRAAGDAGKDARTIRIQPMNWLDVWLPVYGHPRQLRGIGGRWIYDDISGSIYSERAQRPSSYSMSTSLRQPTEKQLRDAPLAPNEVNEVYTQLPELDPRVEQLTDDLVAGKTAPFDKARAIWAHFIESGQFLYDTETDDAGGTDALTHFLLEGKRGFCAQFASAMAVMVRSEGIPARVAVGFTPGTQKGSYRSISTRDAHAWVEVYLGEKFGWVVFDPTPLAGGRGFNAEYLERPQQDRPSQSNPSTGPSESASAPPSTTRAPEGVEPGQTDNAGDQEVSLAQAPGWARWSTVFVVLLAAAATAFGVIVARRTSQLRGRPGAGSDEAGQRLSAAGRWLPLAAAGGWLLSLGLLGWMVSWWLALLLIIVAGAAITPLVMREVSRNRRLHDITLNGPTAPEAAWRELLDECADRGHPVSEADTIRETARRLASQYNLDAEGRKHLQVVATALEKSWYSPTAQVDEQFVAAFEGLRQAINRCAPLPLRGRLLPSSVVKR